MSAVDSNRKEAADRRRNAILEAARTVFARQGYAETVVEDIAAQAGIGKGTLYLYFPSKEQIYFEALLDDARNMDAEARSAMSAARNWKEAIRAAVEVRLRYFDAHRDFLRIFMTEFRGMCIMGKPRLAEFYQLMEDGEAQLSQVFAAAIARGEVRAVDPDLAALTVCEVMRGLLERLVRPWGRPAKPSDAGLVIDMLCRAFEP